MSFSRGNGDRWVLEKGVTNLASVDWSVDSHGAKPFAGGELNDPAAAPGRPNEPKLGNPISGNPPDTTLPAGQDRQVVTGFLAPIETAVKAVITNTLINSVDMGVDPLDRFLSAYMGYHSVWYQYAFPGSCQVGFHTHVGGDISSTTARNAFRVQLNTLIGLL